MSVHPALQLTDIWKSFGATTALRGASLTVATGAIHALIGENGAGKSTLMRVAAGLERPESGTASYFGRTVTGWSPREALQSGIGMVHQHFTLVPSLTALENLILGREPRRTLGVAIDGARARRDAEALMTETQLEVPLDTPIAAMSIGQAQRVEILKALARGARLLICDEPTAVLTPLEVADLWAVLRGVRERGATVVLITHKLDEVMAISDAVTVLRAGRTVATHDTREVSAEQLALAVVGRAAEREDGTAPSAVPRNAPSLISVTRLGVRGRGRAPAVHDVTFSVSGGEIFGIAGVDGNGQSELIEAIAGLRPVSAGSVVLGERDVTRSAVRVRLELGLAHIPEDRQRQGLVLDFSVEDNLVLDRTGSFTRRGALDRRLVHAHAEAMIDEFTISPRDPTTPVRALSGGNQQKVVVARELGRGPEVRVLLAAHPTRGVDVGATEGIHRSLRAARDQGRGVILISADLGELLALSDRIAVMYRGRFALLMDRPGASLERIGRAMMGLSELVSPPSGPRGAAA
jgi:simple sugar transport system ATP-binding protein